jgi:glucokinase
MILAGDVGGTKSNLALFEGRPGAFRQLHYHRFLSHDYRQFEEIVQEFLAQVAGKSPGAITAAGLGVAGPIINYQVRATNLPWMVDGASIAKIIGIERVVLLNDLESTAHSLQWLGPSEYFTLNEGMPDPHANRALIAAGTGLGEAILFWDGKRHVVSATEGGHCDLAPRTTEEIELVRFLRQHSENVDCEAVISGRGFRVIHEFLDAEVRHPSFDAPDVDAAPEITHLAMTNGCPVCVKTVDIWTSLYGAEAGNLALKSLARGGVYVAGGIAVKILPKLKDGTFFRAFCKKAKFSAMLSQIPIRIVLNEDAPLLGAAAQAAASLSGDISRKSQSG